MSKKLLSKRVNFLSVEDMLDEYVPLFTARFRLDADQSDHIRKCLKEVIRKVLFKARHAVKLGAEKGIDEAINLMDDPDYYEVAKRRSQLLRKTLKEQDEKHKGRAALSQILEIGDQ